MQPEKQDKEREIQGDDTVQEEEARQITRKLKLEKASDIDGITQEMINFKQAKNKLRNC